LQLVYPLVVLLLLRYLIQSLLLRPLLLHLPLPGFSFPASSSSFCRSLASSSFTFLFAAPRLPRQPVPARVYRYLDRGRAVSPLPQHSKVCLDLLTTG
jgi:hypothetical protein